MTRRENPAELRTSSNRVLNIDVLGRTVDNQNPTEFPLKTQSELLAARAVMRRFRVSYWHAVTICQLSGLGGAA
ncbi:hypothetical protein JQ506_22905 [Shinella sp. PSBB067]|uniref:hypothetical protein n=1 Tax=Shinella sp. PSBB067 TaxID=2715959 RepID=UPI00193B6E13|nr:hypothetical protein [Shinella sp. PSBB067]QRI63612.1 hypothetical protein JQ506_22905 [Shinella sp. PSBB067]